MTNHVHQHSSLLPNTMVLPSHHCQHLPQQHSEEKAQNVLKRNFSREYTFNSNGLSNQIVTKHVHRHSLPPSTMAPQLAAALEHALLKYLSFQVNAKLGLSDGVSDVGTSR